MSSRIRDPPVDGFFTDVGMEGENGFHAFEHSRRAENMFFGGKYQRAMDEYTSAADYFARAKGNTSNDQALEVLEFLEDYHSSRAQEVSRLSSALVRPLHNTSNPSSKQSSPNLEASVFGQWYQGQPPRLTEQRFGSQTPPSAVSPDPGNSLQHTSVASSSAQSPLSVDLKNTPKTKEGIVRLDSTNISSSQSLREAIYESLINPWQRDFWPKLMEIINQTDTEGQHHTNILFSETLHRTQRNADALLDIASRSDTESQEISGHLSKHVNRMEQSLNALQKSKLKDRVIKLEKELEAEKKKKTRYKKMVRSKAQNSNSN
eukprot:gb/GECH01013377.1/.p1 GENE.gb/GECH01013377.1/~~gb/GECH01013377.1/.p1  ORF type:complete len:319 (+),score=58.52 gb/GECH01013377.1/:1-957(+)